MAHASCQNWGAGYFTAYTDMADSEIDLVVHVDRAPESPARRGITEILAVLPSLHDDFTTQPIFSRSDLGAPLEWTGAHPPARLAGRIAWRPPEPVR